jgi:small GTP-binding protein
MHKLQIWDSGGSERFRAMAPLYYRDAGGCLLVLDVVDAKSFQSIAYWLGELRVKGPDYCVVYVLANKADLVPAFDLQTVENFCIKEGVKFFKVSALTGEGVNAVFTQLAQDISEKKRSR